MGELISLAALRAALGGVIAGGQVLAPGPGHGPRDRSLAARPCPDSPWGVEVYSHAGDPDAFRYVCDRLGITRAPGRNVVELDERRHRRAEAAKAEAADRQRRTDRALAVWREGVEPRGSVVERYLARRALDLPADLAGEVLRYHASCPWEGGRIPAMLALMRCVRTDAPRAIHRTALTADGLKVGRKMLGPSGGAAIKLDAAGPALVVGEGVESAMSARQLGHRPTWAMGSVGEIERLPVLPGIERLSILEEIGCAANARAVEACGTRWSDAGRDVALIRPKAGKDMNDALRELRR